MARLRTLNAQTGDTRLLYSVSAEQDLLIAILAQACIDAYHFHCLENVRPLNGREKHMRRNLQMFFFSDDLAVRTGWTLCAIAPHISDEPDVLVEKVRHKFHHAPQDLKLWAHDIKTGWNLHV